MATPFREGEEGTWRAWRTSSWDWTSWSVSSTLPTERTDSSRCCRRWNRFIEFKLGILFGFRVTARRADLSCYIGLPTSFLEYLKLRWKLGLLGFSFSPTLWVVSTKLSVYFARNKYFRFLTCIFLNKIDSLFNHTFNLGESFFSSVFLKMGRNFVFGCVFSIFEICIFGFLFFLLLVFKKCFSNLFILQWLTKMCKLYFFAQILLSHHAKINDTSLKKYFFRTGRNILSNLHTNRLSLCSLWF